MTDTPCESMRKSALDPYPKNQNPDSCDCRENPMQPGLSPLNRRAMLREMSLVELATDGARDGLGGVHVGVEGLGAILDLLQGEASASVLAIADDTGLEGTLEAALAGADLVALGVGEGNSAANVSVTAR